jgi:hypothetical protein
MQFRGGESQRGTLSLFSGYSEKAHRTGEPALHSIKRGGGRRFRAETHKKQKTRTQPTINRNYLKGGYRLLRAASHEACQFSHKQTRKTHGLEPALYSALFSFFFQTFVESRQPCEGHDEDSVWLSSETAFEGKSSSAVEHAVNFTFCQVSAEVAVCCAILIQKDVFNVALLA